MINFLIYHHSQKYSFTRRPNTQLYMQFACYRKQKIKKFINPQSRQQQNASPSPYHPIGTTSHIPTPQNTTTSQQPPVTTTKNSFKKKPEGCAEGPRLCGPFAVFLQSFKKTTTSCRFLQYPLSSVHADLPLCKHPQVPYPPSYQPLQNKHPV